LIEKVYFVNDHRLIFRKNSKLYESLHVILLRFSSHAAQWVADEIWHPGQRTHWLDDGRFELSIPYHESPELVGEIMRWMPEV
jgi:hypothetical protein